MIKEECICRICKSQDITAVQVRDWLSKDGKDYYYNECAECGTLAIHNLKDVPGPEYYNLNYGSFIEKEVSSYSVREILRNCRNRYVFMYPSSFIASIFNYLKPLPFSFTALSQYANSKSLILDVGCGSGKYLKVLKEAGYSNLSGIDPYLAQEEDLVSGISIRKKSIEEISEKFEIIISHHSLEHSKDPIEMLKAICRNLSTNGFAIITIPILGKLYKKYREYSYIIQAPQHTFLFTIYGMIYVSRMAGLELVEMKRGSEFEADWIKTSDSWKSMASAASQIASDLDLSGPGDNVTFVLKKA